MSIDTGVGRPEFIGHALYGKRNAMLAHFVQKNQYYVFAMDTRFDSLYLMDRRGEPRLIGFRRHRKLVPQSRNHH